MAEARGFVVVDTEECKGCGLCVESCPPKCLELTAELSHQGVHPAQYLGEHCTGCGICFYCCPEPGAITVYKREQPAKTPAFSSGEKEATHAATV